MELKDIIAGFEQTTTASIADVLDKRGFRGFMNHDIKARTVEKKFVGPAITVKEVRSPEALPPRHAMEAIEHAEPGSVVVISVEDGADVAVWGGIMTAGAVTKGLVGAVLEAGVRDVTEIRRDFGFPVYAKSVVPSTTVGRYVTIANQVPVFCAGVLVTPGDIVIADADGVVVVPRAWAEEVLAEAQAIDAKEANMAREIRECGSLIQIIDKYNRI